MNAEKKNRTAGEAGWRQSRYNLIAAIPGTDRAAIANLFRGTCAAYTPIELFLLSEAETLAEDHPILERFKQRGLIVNFDELEALKAMGRGACAGRRAVGLTICPTMSCNFDCPYCFETHTPGSMTEQVQEEVTALAERMLDTAGADRLCVTWFGGEPLLAVGVIERLSEKLTALAAARNANYSASIITNGYLLTQSVADLLGRCGVSSAQITLDGLGDTHNATRHLAGGGPTFERITANLRELKLPFPVRLRHNIHAGNRDEMEALKAFAEKLEKESGNQIRYDPALVSGNDAADARGTQPRLLCGPDAGEVGIRRSAERFRAGRGHFCGAQWLYSVGIDAQGRLYKCWEDVDKPERCFGTAARWDPKDPIATADAPDKLTRYLNTAMPFEDAECLACPWLPMCVGGCPSKRLNYNGKACLPFKEQPDRYVLALYAHIGQTKREYV